MRNRYIDYLRLAATFGVVLWHSSSNVYYKFGPDSEWMYANVMFGALVRWSVPCFVMLSGALLLSRDEEMGVFYKKRLLRIFIPLITWTIIYGIARLYYFKVYAYGNSNAPRPSLFSFLAGQFKDLFFLDLSYHLYFVSIILGLYLIAPFIRAMVKNVSRRQIEWLILFSIIIIGTKQFYQNVLFVSHFQIGSSLLYFILGYYFHTYELSKKQLALIFSLGIAAIAGMTYLNYNREYLHLSHGDFYYQYDGIFVIILSCFVFVLFKYLFRKEPVKTNFIKRFFLKLSSYSYGIYIAHPLAISFLWYSGVSWFTFSQWESLITFSDDYKVRFLFNGAWGAVVMAFIIFFACSLFFWLVEKVRLLKYFT